MFVFNRKHTHEYTLTAAGTSRCSQRCRHAHRPIGTHTGPKTHIQVHRHTNRPIDTHTGPQARIQAHRHAHRPTGTHIGPQACCIYRPTGTYTRTVGQGPQARIHALHAHTSALGERGDYLPPFSMSQFSIGCMQSTHSPPVSLSVLGPNRTVFFLKKIISHHFSSISTTYEVRGLETRKSEVIKIRLALK